MSKADKILSPTDEGVADVDKASDALYKALNVWGDAIKKHGDKYKKDLNLAITTIKGGISAMEDKVK